jgi:hypothetical protein
MKSYITGLPTEIVALIANVVLIPVVMSSVEVVNPVRLAIMLGIVTVTLRVFGSAMATVAMMDVAENALAPME